MTYYCAKYAFIPQQNGRIVNIIAQIQRGFPGMVHTGAARYFFFNNSFTFEY